MNVVMQQKMECRLYRLNQLSPKQKLDYLAEKLAKIDDPDLKQLLDYHRAQCPIFLYSKPWSIRFEIFVRDLLRIDNQQIKATILKYTVIGITQCLNMQKVCNLS